MTNDPRNFIKDVRSRWEGVCPLRKGSLFFILLLSIFSSDAGGWTFCCKNSKYFSRIMVFRYTYSYEAMRTIFG